MLRRMESGIAGKEFSFDYLSSAREMAVGCGLVGTVFEKDDGSVKLIAEGEEEDLFKFAEKLEKLGFMHTVVDNFYVQWDEPTGEFKDFSIGNNV